MSTVQRLREALQRLLGYVPQSDPYMSPTGDGYPTSAELAAWRKRLQSAGIMYDA